MKFIEQPERLAVLRPQDSALALLRLAEWNRILDDAADDAHAQERATKEADEHWKATLRGQQWRFLGHLGSDLKSVLDAAGEIVATCEPGDLMERDSRVRALWGTP